MMHQVVGSYLLAEGILLFYMLEHNYEWAFHSLNIGAESLYNTRQGVDTTSHNMANAQTEGYSRQRVNLTTRDPLSKRNLLIGNGSYIKNITRSHDQFVENQLVKASSAKGESDAAKNELLALEEIFNPELANSVSDEMNSFFDAINSLANFPEELSTRTTVYEQGKNLIAAFKRVDSEVKRNRDGINDSLAHMTGEITDSLRTIADLNIQISQSEVGQQNQANDLRDKRDLLVRNLSEKMDISYYEDKWGMLTIRGPSDILMVEGNSAVSFQYQVNSDNENMYDIIITDFEGDPFRNVTDAIGAGSLKSMIDVRDRVASNLLKNNNVMAMTFANRFNEIHRDGFGLKDFRESRGRNFFDPVTDVDSAAKNLQFSLDIENSVDAIAAASTPNAPGDNIIANRLLSLRNEKMLDDGNATFTEHYANYVGNLGIETVRAKHVSEANDILKGSLESAREAVSGVSLDEEAANMIKWQTAFTASSKVITTVDEMLETVLSLKR
ncbi:MAG: flagellar hook-associated protein FlgK [Bdellovibrionota bacterium]